MGAGTHGGFGNTRGSKRANLIKISYSKKGKLTQAKASHTRESLLKEIDGHTTISSEIAKNIKNGNVHINVLGDKLFSEYLGVDSDTVGLTVGNQIYLRASSASIISDLVHEGNHAIEYISGISVNNIRTWPGEIRAYKAEREFQIKTKRDLTFKNENDLLVHVWSNYEREVK